MTFSSKQLLALQSDVDPTFTRTRKLEDGRELPYIEGWYAISEANRIFGFDAWSRETVEVKCLQSREVRGSFQVLYLAKVRLTVRAGAHLTVREGYGTGSANSGSLSEAHEKAVKSAETDATKRALATFGRPFGLALHTPAPERTPASLHHARIPEANRRRTRQRKGADGRYLAVIDQRMPLVPRELAEPITATVTTLPVPDRGTLKSDGTVHAESAPDAAAVNPNGVQEVVPIVKTLRRRSPQHLRYVMQQPCLICGRAPSDAHHLRFTQPRALGRKVSDEFTVPLCRTHHRQLHHSGDEVAWWIAMEVDPLPIAQDLWGESQRVSKNQALSGAL